MSTPLTDRINLLTSQANATTGASDATLSDAVGTLIAGYGQGGGAETVTVVATATNALQCMKNIFVTPEPGYICVAVITGKPKSSWVTDQFIGGIIRGDSYNGTGLRYRNSAFGTCEINGAYDAKVEVGDVFTAIKIPYS